MAHVFFQGAKYDLLYYERVMCFLKMIRDQHTSCADPLIPPLILICDHYEIL